MSRHPRTVLAVCLCLVVLVSICAFGVGVNAKSSNKLHPLSSEGNSLAEKSKSFNIGYSRNCDGCSFSPNGGSSNSTLTCNCAVGYGSSATLTSTLNLDNCLGTDPYNGNLVSGNGKYDFDATCQDCSLSGTTLTCYCPINSGGFNSASINLDNFITICEGVLCC